MKVLHPTLISKWKFAWNRFRKKQNQSNNLNPNGIHRSFGFRMDLNPCKSLFWKGRRSLFKMNCMDYRHDKISTGWPMRNISKQSDANASSLQLRRRAALFSKNLRNHCDRLIKLSSDGHKACGIISIWVQRLCDWSNTAEYNPLSTTTFYLFFTTTFIICQYAR